MGGTEQKQDVFFADNLINKSSRYGCNYYSYYDDTYRQSLGLIGLFLKTVVCTLVMDSFTFLAIRTAS